MENEDATVDPSVRACRELFEILVRICGTQNGATEVRKRAFWFSFDGSTPVAIPEHSVEEFAGWVNGATKLMTVLIDDGFFKQLTSLPVDGARWVGR